MADDVTLNAGSGGDVIAADDIGPGVKYQRVKVTLGADGTNDGDVASGNPMPVSGTVTANLAAGTNGIGKLTANSGVDIGDVDVTSIVPGTGATNLGKAEDGAHTTGDVGVMALSVRQDEPAALGDTDGDYQPLITDATGRLHVATKDLTQNGSIAATGSNTFTIGDGVATVALRVSGTWVGTLDFEGSVDATTWDPIYGVRAGVGIPYTQISESLADNIFRFTTAGFRQVRARFTRTSGTVLVAWQGSHSTSGVYINFPLPPGTNTIGALTANQSVNIAQMNGVSTTMGNGVSGTGVQRVTVASDSTGVLGATQSGTWTVQPGNTANTTAWLVSPRPAASGGNSFNHLVSAATTNATVVKASAGQVYGWSIVNTNASMRYVKLHNTASTPTAGASVAYTIGVPGTGGSNIALHHGIAFGTGIAFTTVTGAADSDTTAVAANDLIINIHYT